MGLKYKLINNRNNIWFGDDHIPWEVGKIVDDEEIVNEKPMSYWIRGQEKYWQLLEEITKKGVVDLDCWLLSIKLDMLTIMKIAVFADNCEEAIKKTKEKYPKAEILEGYMIKYIK